MRFPHDIAIGDKYEPAMKITDPDEAGRYFEACVEHTLRCRPQLSRDEAESIERSNLGYYAGYCSHETRARVERLFSCADPIFGAVAEVRQPTPEQALELGKTWASLSQEGAPE